MSIETLIKQSHIFLKNDKIFFDLMLKDFQNSLLYLQSFFSAEMFIKTTLESDTFHVSVMYSFHLERFLHVENCLKRESTQKKQFIIK